MSGIDVLGYFRQDDSFVLISSSFNKRSQSDITSHLIESKNVRTFKRSEMAADNGTSICSSLSNITNVEIQGILISCFIFGSGCFINSCISLDLFETKSPCLK